ncbi:MAG TPA: tetratricopeptide repeat protein [Anaeromyxobacteraceae bacterium]|nr:tetratricopeptide repeat protein [Anaeromyxobacteraceae bacterium]
MRLLPAALCLAAACASAPAPVAKAPPPPPAAPAPAPVARAPRLDLLVASARTLRASGDAEGAREVLEAALTLAPASDEARLELAGQLVADGRDLDRAARLVAEARPAGGARARALEGELAELRGDDPGAATAYASALEASPDPDVRLRRALVLERLGRADEALRELHQASVERPGDPVGRARLADRYEAAGQLAAAEEQLKAAAESAPDRPAEWDRLARFYARIGKPDRARAAEARARVAAGTAPARKLRPLLRSSR